MATTEVTIDFNKDPFSHREICRETRQDNMCPRLLALTPCGRAIRSRKATLGDIHPVRSCVGIAAEGKQDESRETNADNPHGPMPVFCPQHVTIHPFCGRHLARDGTDPILISDHVCGTRNTVDRTNRECQRWLIIATL